MLRALSSLFSIRTERTDTAKTIATWRRDVFEGLFGASFGRTEMRGPGLFCAIFNSRVWASDYIIHRSKIYNKAATTTASNQTAAPNEHRRTDRGYSGPTFDDEHSETRASRRRCSTNSKNISESALSTRASQSTFRTKFSIFSRGEHLAVAC